MKEKEKNLKLDSRFQSNSHFFLSTWVLVELGEVTPRVRAEKQAQCHAHDEQYTVEDLGQHRRHAALARLGDQERK